MALRCFARRHLVAVRGHTRLVSSCSKALQAHELPSQRRSGVVVRPQHGSLPDFFSSKSPVPHAFTRKAKGRKFEESNSVSKDVAAHPLVQELRQELHSEHISTSAEKVWNLYLAIHQSLSNTTAGTGSSTHSSAYLRAQDHQSVLRAITKQSARQLQREKKDRSLVSYRYEGSLLPGGQVDESAQSYLRRVAFIFSQLRLSDHANVPDVNDYNVVLQRLAPYGNMPAVTALWRHLTGSTSEDFSSNRRRFTSDPDAASHSTQQPTSKTYVFLMLGISRHLGAQIERAHKAVITQKIWRGDGKKRRHKEQVSAKAAARGQALFGQEVAPQARLAVRLASQRTVSVLRDMVRRKIAPEKITSDLAMRILRMDGNLPGIRLLAKMYGIDLENPDADPSTLEGSSDTKIVPDVHTINTLLMTFGEQATISEMVTIYETLTRPLPRRGMAMEQGQMEQQLDVSLFATDWRGIFTKDTDIGVIDKDSSEDNPETREVPLLFSTHPPAILVNTTTMTVMIKHCCVAPDPARMIAALEPVGSKRARIRAEDHAARQRGDYIGVADYLLSEAMDLQRQEIERIARQIGVQMPDVTSLHAKLVESVREAQKGRKSAASGQQDMQDAQIFITAEENEENLRSVMLRMSKDSAQLLSGLADDFVPRFTPPALAVNVDILRPILSHASKHHRSNFSRWQYLITQIERVITIKIAERQVLQAAITKWEDLRLCDGLIEDPLMSKKTLEVLITALRKQRRMVFDELVSLGNYLSNTVIPRFDRLRELRRARRDRSFEKTLQERKLVMQAKKEEAEKKEQHARRKEARDAEAQQEVNESVRKDMQPSPVPIPAVEPMYK